MIVGVIILLMAIILLNSCEDAFTKMINISIYNPNHGNGNGASFTDNDQKVPCNFEEPLTEPIN